MLDTVPTATNSDRTLQRMRISFFQNNPPRPGPRKQDHTDKLPVRSALAFRLNLWRGLLDSLDMSRHDFIPPRFDRLGLAATRGPRRNENITQGLHEEKPEQSDNDAA
jgi:hypothetical protein